MRQMIPEVRIFDVPFSRWSMEETVHYLSKAVEQRDSHQVITANPIMIMEALRQPEYMKVMQAADLVVPDGIGAVWAADKVGRPVKERVPGFDLMHKLLELGSQKGWRVFLLGARPDVVQLAAKKLTSQYPGIELVGVQDGYFKEDQDEEVVAQIRKVQPDLLFVARAAANQEPWIARYKDRLQVPVMMGVGGSFDVIAGKLKRAPLVFQRLRLEWFYRLLQEPWRYKRMLVLPKFVLKVICEKEKMKLRQK